MEEIEGASNFLYSTSAVIPEVPRGQGSGGGESDSIEVQRKSDYKSGKGTLSLSLIYLLIKL